VRMRAVPFVLAAILGVAAAALVSCGGTAGSRSDLIPQGSADKLKTELADVRSAVDDGDCEAASRALSQARGTVGRLPASVDDRLVARIREGISQLETLAPEECAQQQTQTTTVPTTETTTPETTATTDTTPTETTDTTPTETTTTTTPTETTTTAPPTTTTAPPTTAAPAPADPSGGTPTP
jgi:hypothetical protein